MASAASISILPLAQHTAIGYTGFVTVCHSGFPADTTGLGLMEHEYPKETK